MDFFVFLSLIVPNTHEILERILAIVPAPLA